MYVCNFKDSVEEIRFRVTETSEALIESKQKAHFGQGGPDDYEKRHWCLIES